MTKSLFFFLLEHIMYTVKMPIYEHPIRVSLGTASYFYSSFTLFSQRKKVIPFHHHIMVYKEIIAHLQKEVDPEKAAFFPYFFKTGKGEYGEGDQFLGITVPQQRTIAKKYTRLATLKDIAALLESPIHEHRLTALLILVYKNEKASPEEKKIIFDFYLRHTKGINNWDLVDTSARYIVGAYLLSTEKKENTPKLLVHLAHSENLWERRIGVIATYAYIREGLIEPTFEITKLLMNDTHDLIHKACGWMLREAGKHDKIGLDGFLNLHAPMMPRTMLRYAIERHVPEERAHFMHMPITRK